jgi:2-polyprenyl-6-methoxyphenol hydroxylase-like FAD-dependent oxidoreductase
MTRDSSGGATSSIVEHVVIIGAGMAGMAAAAALSPHCGRVTLLERDELPAHAAPRRGLPQSNQLHGLLAGGMQALETLYPGFGRDLAEAGAPSVRAGLDDRLEMPGYDPFPARDLGFSWSAMSRPLIDHLLRRRVRALPNARLRGDCRVRAITLSDGGRPDGVLVIDAGGRETRIAAGLVIDASSHGTPMLGLLRELGLKEPERTEVGVDIAYATATFALPDDSRKWSAVMTFPEQPGDTRCGYIFKVENGWTALISRRHEPIEPLDTDGFLELARQLRTPTIYTALRGGTPLGRVHRVGFPASCWQHYERVEGLPEGVLAIGDAVCRLNPIYGQGMTVAVKEAVILGQLLQARRGQPDPPGGLGGEFFAAIQPLIGAAWSSSAIPDFVHPLTRGERPEDLPQKLGFMAALYRLAAIDPAVHVLVSSARHLLGDAQQLNDPALLRRLEAEAH